MELSIGILISNRIETVPKVMESLKPFVEAGIAEIVAVDTVSGTEGMISDGSFEVVKKYTENISVFPWIKDFSAARNVTLDRSSGEWYMFVDDDEWFEDATEIVDFFRSGEYKNYESASYLIRNYKNPEGTEWGDTRAVRLVRRTPELRFTGRIHETFNSLRLPCKEFSCFAHHYGYAYASEEERKKHSERNLSLLKEEIEENPDDLRLHTQMALELASTDNEKAITFVEECLKKFEKEKDEQLFMWLIAIQFPLYEALGKKASEAESLLQKMKKSYALSETAELAISYEMTRLYLLENNGHLAIGYIRRYFELLAFLKQNKGTAQIQNVVDFAKYWSSETENEMKQFEEYCMANENQGFKLENGLISFGTKNFDFVGTTEEKLQQLNALGFDDFVQCIDQLCEKTPSCFEDPFLSEAMVFFEKESQIEYCYILYKCAETEIKRAVANGANGVAISELLTECIITERRMYELLYKPEVFSEEGLKWLPIEVTYNDILYRFVESEGRELKLVLEAARLRPDMAPVMKAWLGALS